jgi:hypothetical protein
MDQTPTDPSASAPLVVNSTVVDPTKKPDLSAVTSVNLRTRPRHRVDARYTVIRDRHTGEVHHNALTVETWRRQGTEEVVDPKNTVSLTDEGDEDEIAKLHDFIGAAHAGVLTKQSGRLMVVAAPDEQEDADALQKIVGHLQSAGQYQVFAEVLREVGQDPALLQALTERAAKNPQLFAEAAAALRLVSYRNTVNGLRSLVEAPDTKEEKFQELLAAHPWMFGSEYSELLPRRRWSRDENQDFVVRCTTDGFIELIEIKTTLGGVPLLLHDPSHDSHYPRAELSKVVGQVQKYIEVLDADRDRIKARDGEDTAKIRAKIIIGRDGDADQSAALRRFNGHLHRMEVLTYDQLLRIAERVVGYLEDALHPAGAN